MNPALERLCNASGNVTIQSRLVGFLYELMRDSLPVGEVERLVQNSENTSDIEYTNGFLALYAENLAKRLGDNPVRITRTP